MSVISKNKTKQITDARVLIIDYYDLQISRIDIYTEQSLEELAKIQPEPTTTPSSSRVYAHHHHHHHHEQPPHTHPRRQHINIQADGGVSYWSCEESAKSLAKRRPSGDADYLNKCRMRAITEIKKIQEESLKLYKLNAGKIDAEFKRLRTEKKPDEDEEELLRQLIFAKKFCFVIIVDANKFKFKYEAFTVLCDYYMSETNVKYLQQLLNDKKFESSKANLTDQLIVPTVFDLKLVLVTEGQKAIQKRFENLNDGDEILNLKKSEILSMKFLSYQHAKLKRVESAQLPHLKCFALCHNPIEYIAPNAFDGMSDLESLFLFSNNLIFDEEHSQLFKTLTGCRKLNLSFNYIGYMHPTSLDNMANLQDLNLSSNRLVFNDTNSCLFENLRIIHTLNIGYNTLEKLTPAYFKNNSLLKCLVLRGCNMVEIEEKSFDSLRILNQLDLTSNKLVTLPKNLFSKTVKLEDLNLLNNDIVDFDDEFFDNMINLKVLWLSSNKLTKINSRWFAQLTELKELCLGNNLIETIELNSFDMLENLEKLDISYNSKIENNLNGSRIFLSLYNLKTLNLDQNEMTEIKNDLFEGLDNLEKLSLARNKLDRLNVNALRGLNKLNHLTLDSNLLTQIQLNVLTVLPNIQRISLSNNPFSSQDIEKLKDNSRVFYFEYVAR